MEKFVRTRMEKEDGKFKMKKLSNSIDISKKVPCPMCKGKGNVSEWVLKLEEIAAQAAQDNADKIAELELKLNQALVFLDSLFYDEELEIIGHVSPDCGKDYWYCSLCGKESKSIFTIEHKEDCLYLKIKKFLDENMKEEEK